MIEPGTVWNDCILMRQDRSVGGRQMASDSGMEAALAAHLEQFPNAEGKAIWYDRHSGTCFSAAQMKGGPAGKDYHFLSESEDFLEGMWGRRFVAGSLYYSEVLRPLERSECTEVIRSRHRSFDGVSGRRLLLIFGGPSTRQTDWDQFDRDITWSCNKFYLNSAVAAARIDLVALAPDVSLIGNHELHDYLAAHDTTLAFEIDRGASVGAWRDINEVTEWYADRSVFFHVRYQSVLGLGTRMLVLALLLGAREIGFVGLDGMMPEGPRHAFEAYKENPKWMSRFGPDLQRRQYVVFWEYVLQLTQHSGARLYNLGEECPYNLSREISKSAFALPEEIRERVSSLRR